MKRVGSGCWVVILNKFDDLRKSCESYDSTVLRNISWSLRKNFASIVPYNDQI